MTCYHPLKRFSIGLNPETDKSIGKVVSYNTNFLYYDSKLKKYIPVYDDNSSFDFFGNQVSLTETQIQTIKDNFDFFDDFVVIGCGNCLGCRIDYSREWANRMLLELPYCDKSCFITLTYSDEFVPTSEYVDLNGTFCTSLTLRKRDFQLFMKRLRKHFPEFSIRFFAAGEYGDTTFRPHYHAVLFGVDFDDKVFFKKSREKFNYYISDTLSRLWGKGHALLTDVSWETCAYTARYVTKKHKGKDKDFYDFFNIEPEFALMSRKPGLGRLWYNEHCDDLTETYIITHKTPTGGRSFFPPHYFDKLFDVDFPDEFASIRESRRLMVENAKNLKLSKTSKSYLELLAVEESNFKHSTKSLRRGDTDVQTR